MPKTAVKKRSFSNSLVIGNNVVNSAASGPEMLDLIHEECLFELFENTARKFPQNTAIIFGESSITYKELNELANKIAYMLRKKGIKAEDRVAILMPKSIECYAAIIGAMKAGACYIPLDVSYPEDRVRYIVEDSCAKYILVAENSDCGTQFKNTITISQKKLRSSDCQNIGKELSGAGGHTLAYIIYTSGSTGRPKGVMIEHKSACHLVRAEQQIYKITPDDRVYQGFTLAFDASVEEVWMAFFNGAALIPQTEQMKKAGPDLFKILKQYNVSVISCVPTLLSMISDDIPTLRLLILGGEACPESVVERFKKDGRRILNTYGPTEATVIATWSEMKPGEKVTIGKPIPNYYIYVMKDNNELAKIGEAGELLIGGIGLARGYVGREDLNKEKFIVNNFTKSSPNEPDRLYRSGDLVALDADGNIEFHGRIDDQVKIRGYRVELSEIENVANMCSQVKVSVAKVNEFDDSSEMLCLYAVPENKELGIEIQKLLEVMKDRLPAYMMPQNIMVIDEMPLLPSGKADRTKLPKPNGEVLASNRPIEEASSVSEKIIADVVKKVFKISKVSIKDHLFNDLGGHSLYAAQVVSSLRNENGYESTTIVDLYENPTIETLALKFGGNKSKSEPKSEKKAKADYYKVSDVRHAVCGFFQGVSLLLLSFLICTPVGYVIYHIFNKDFSIRDTIFSLLLTALLYSPVALMLSILAKWLVIGKYKEGSYPLWGTYYFRWWLARLFQRLYPEHLISGTPLMPLYLKLMGAKVGKDCFIGTHQFGAFDLISIGEGTSISQDCQILGYTVKNGYITFGRVTVGKECYVGTHSTLCINSEMKDSSMLKEQSMLPSGTSVPCRETWAGSPAVRSGEDSDLKKLYEKSSETNIFKKLAITFLHSIMLIFLAFVSLLIMVQGFSLGIFFNKIPAWLFFASPITALLIIFLTVFEIIVLKKLLMYRLKPGIYSVYSVYYVRKWAADNIIYISLQVLHTLYATLYTIPFLKALGAKIGKRVEVSTVTHISPELFEVGEGSFFADASMAGTPKIYKNHVMYDKIKIGARTFIGNSAIVPISSEIGDDCLIGVMSIPPDKAKIENGTSWLGTPAMFLHRRDVNNDFSDKTTYNPSRLLYIKRLMIELIRLVLPTSVYVISSYILANIFSTISTSFSFWTATILMTLTMILYEFAMIMFVVLLKYSLIGTYTPCVNPLWSSFVWKTELVTGVYENLLGDYILTPLTGTPFLPVIMRLFGCRIGKKVFLDTIYMSEFDLVRIGNEAAVNYNSTMQTHLFEDRVLKMSYLAIGNQSSVGNGAVVLYDTFMEEGSTLGSSSLLMKGEVLKANTHWHGNPTCMEC